MPTTPPFQVVWSRFASRYFGVGIGGCLQQQWQWQWQRQGQWQWQQCREHRGTQGVAVGSRSGIGSSSRKRRSSCFASLLAELVFSVFRIVFVTSRAFSRGSSNKSKFKCGLQACSVEGVIVVVWNRTCSHRQGWSGHVLRGPLGSLAVWLSCLV